MPALEAFGRRWKIGSDDFVLPALIDTLIRLSWLIASIVIYLKNDSNLTCDGGTVMRIYIYGVFIILSLIIKTDIALALFSMSGNIADTRARRHVVPTLYIRTFLQVLEISWNVLGSVWALREDFNCSAAPQAVSLIQGLIICNWVLSLLLLLDLYFVFDPLGREEILLHRVEHEKKNDEIWEARCTLFCCSCGGRNENVRKAFKEVGRMFGLMFEDEDLVPTDVAAGLLLLFFRSRDSSRRLQTVQPIPRSPHKEEIIMEEPESVFTKPPLTLLNQHWQSLPKVSHFLKYAMGVYGWPMVAFGSPKQLGNWWQKTHCCSACIPGRSYPVETVEGDNCCFWDTSALREIAGVNEEDLIFVSYRNKVFKTPFFVALDHPTHSIVISIRGTLSFGDLLTDLYAWPAELQGPGIPQGFKAHHGMILAAKNIKEEIEKHKIIQKIHAKYPTYNIVLTGTSLGAGTATILGILMVPQYPTLKCYTYAPPAGLLSLEAAKFSESFILSLVYGEDMVCRLSIQSFELLKLAVLAAIQECKAPKYRILLGSCIFLQGGTPSISYYDNEERRDSVAHLIHSPSLNYSNNFDWQNNNDRRISLQLKLQQERKPFPSESLYPPGKIIHVTETSFFKLGHKNPSYSGESRWTLRWAERAEFKELIVSPRMLADHFPFRLEKALKALANNPHAQNLLTCDKIF